MAPPKKKQQKQGDKPETSWAETVKAVGLSALERGQFITFGLILVALVLAYKMESADVVKIAELGMASNVWLVMGWVLFVLTAGGMTYLLGKQREMYLSEIDRLSHERNHWQKECGIDHQPSGYSQE